LHSSLLPHTRYTPRHLILLDFTTRTILGKEYRSFSFSLCNSSFPCHLIPLSPKYPPHHPILKHPQPTFLPQCQWPSFKPIKNNGQNYSSVYLDLWIFGLLNDKHNGMTSFQSVRFNVTEVLCTYYYTAIRVCRHVLWSKFKWRFTESYYPLLQGRNMEAVSSSIS
jgi:hypothetical protein